jgi:hypothetical protein
MNGKMTLPKAPWILYKQEEVHFKSYVAIIWTPMGYIHSLRGEFTRDNILSGMKSHDSNKILQHALPVALKGCLTEAN